MESRDFPKEIIEKAKDSDSKAIAEIFEHYYTKIYRYLYYRTMTTQDAEDLASEVFVKVVKSIKRQSGNFESWLYMIAKNTLTDYYRRNSVRKEYVSDEEVLENIPDNAKINSGSLTQEELKIAINKLTNEQQEVVTLRFIEGYDNRETAQIMDKSIGAVKSLQFRALISLKEILKEG
ncbi:MAG: RNA polymerase sigma factor [Candidatus Firestonebacteria bacterium]